jgi:hypothetical protein
MRLSLMAGLFISDELLYNEFQQMCHSKVSSGGYYCSPSEGSCLTEADTEVPHGTAAAASGVFGIWWCFVWGKAASHHNQAEATELTINKKNSGGILGRVGYPCHDSSSLCHSFIDA